MTPSIAYLAQGKLYLKLQDSSIREIESQFGQTLQERTLKVQRNKAWKNRGLMEMMMPPAALKQMEQQPESTVNVTIASLCPLENGRLLYALEAGDMGGIFAFDPDSDREDRLFHNAEFQVGHLDFDIEHKLIACTTIYRTGISNIATMPIDGARPRDVTEGDSIDLAARWVPGKGKALVFQSAGIGRNSSGYVCDRAPFLIEKLDFDKQDVLTLASDPKSDLLGPQIGRDGWLYYIRRPYRPIHKQFSLWQSLKDLLLIPFRLLYAIFQWLNFFSQMYTGKPLMAAGTKQTVDPKQMKVWGDWITPEMMRDRRFGEPDAPALVPRSWQLVRQADQGTPEVLAEGILSYDLATDGTIVYTNGSAVYAIYPDGTRERLLVDNLIETVTILGNAT
ncbi:MAG: hypothetical protein WCA35_31350 [Kovacikia sp.]